MEKQDNHQEILEQEERKTDFESDFWNKKDFWLDRLNSPAMKTIAENYDNANPAKTLDNVIDAIAWNSLNSLNTEEKAKFEELKTEFIAELELDENWKLTPDAIKEMAENISDLTDFIWSLNWGKAKISENQAQALQKATLENQKANREFSEKIRNFIAEVNERKAKEVEQARKNAETAKKEWDKEKIVAEASWEKLLDNWPA